eukprot:1952915-Pleurochrysis_carterae.AAC.2
MPSHGSRMQSGHLGCNICLKCAPSVRRIELLGAPCMAQARCSSRGSWSACNRRLLRCEREGGKRLEQEGVEQLKRGDVCAQRVVLRAGAQDGLASDEGDGSQSSWTRFVMASIRFSLSQLFSHNTFMNIPAEK